MKLCEILGLDPETVSEIVIVLAPLAPIEVRVQQRLTMAQAGPLERHFRLATWKEDSA
jgi:hypothetical protein